MGSLRAIGMDHSEDVIGVLIADDHAIVRAGLRQILADYPDIDVVEEAGNGAEAVERAANPDVHVVLLDISMPDSNVADTLALLRRRQPDLPVLILSMHPEEQYAINLLRLGASGYVSKGREGEELVAAIRAAHQGKRYVSASLAEQLAAEAAGEAAGPLHRTLSAREFQVFSKLAGGMSVSQIAADLCLSVKTVSTHRTRILQKMDMKSNADLTYYAVKNNLIQ